MLHCDSDWQEFNNYSLVLSDRDKVNINKYTPLVSNDPEIFRLNLEFYGDLRIYGPKDMVTDGVWLLLYGSSAYVEAYEKHTGVRYTIKLEKTLYDNPEG